MLVWTALSWIGEGGGDFYKNIFKGVCRPCHLQELFSESELTYYFTVWLAGRLPPATVGDRKAGYFP